MPNIPSLPSAPAADTGGLLIIDSGGVTYSITVANLLNFSSLVDFSISDSIGGLYFSHTGQVYLRGPGNCHVSCEPAGSVNIGPDGTAPVEIFCPLGGDIVFNVAGFPALTVGKDGSGTVATQLQYRLCVGFSAPASTPGSIVAAFPIYDLTGTLIGYVPVFDSIV